jgi:hypothetical protein
MIIIRFADQKAKASALGLLAGHFSFKSWATGEMMIPKDALALLADEGVRYTVEGPATYERLGSLQP